MKHFVVASFTDAWIETLVPLLKTREKFESHLLQMRGLKRERCQCWIMETFGRIFYRCVD